MNKASSGNCNPMGSGHKIVMGDEIADSFAKKAVIEKTPDNKS